MRFFLSKSGRSYYAIPQTDGSFNVFFWARDAGENGEWVPAKRTVEELLSDPRIEELLNEDAFGYPAKKAYRELYPQHPGGDTVVSSYRR